MKAQVYSIDGKSVGELDLPSSLFGQEVNDALIAQSVKMYLANQRQGNAVAKGRSDVSGTSKKMYRQKGTGRARHGDAKAPIFVGGGVVHGPQIRDFTLKMPKKMKKRALVSALSSQSELVSVLRLGKEKTLKTKDLIMTLNNIAKDARKLLLIVDDVNSIVRKGADNLDNVMTMQAKDLNPYILMHHDKLIVTEPSLKIMEETFGQV